MADSSCAGPGATAAGLLRRAALLAAAGLAALAIDMPVAAWFKDGVWPASMPRILREIADEVARLVTMSEVCAHTVSVAVILGLLLALDRSLAWPIWRWPVMGRPTRQPSAARARFARILGATFAGGLLTDVIKLLVDRVRPRALDFVHHASVWDGFSDSLVATIGGSRSNINSFPSGHSAVAAGLAAALAWKYPRGRWFFATFALMAAAQRVLSSAHFPSDACFGAALGMLGASLFLHVSPADGAGADGDDGSRPPDSV